MNHWVIGPVLLPMLVAIGLMLAEQPWLRRAVAFGGSLLCAALVIWLVNRSRFGGLEVYVPGNTLPPAGAVLVLDKMASMMLAVLALLHLAALAAMVVAGQDRDRPVHLLKAEMLLAGAGGVVLAGDMVSLWLFWGLALASSAGSAQHIRLVLLPGLAALAVGLTFAAILGGSANLADLAERSAGAQGLALAALALWSAGFWAMAQSPVAAPAGLAATAVAGRLLLMQPVGIWPAIAAVLLALAMAAMLRRRGQARAMPSAAAVTTLMALLLFGIGTPQAVQAALVALLLAALLPFGAFVVAAGKPALRAKPTAAIGCALVLAVAGSVAVSGRFPAAFAGQIAATARQLQQPELYITAVMGLPETPMLAPDPGL